MTIRVAPMTRPPHIRTPVRIALGLILVTTAAYLPLHGNGFIDVYDDYEYVVDNPRVSAGPSIAGLSWAFSSFHAVNWHPLTWVSHMVDCRLYGLNPGGHHLTSLVLHIANVLLLFGLLRSMTGAVWKSAIVAAAVAVHPLNVQNVAWVAERKELLSTFFGLLSLAAYVGYVRGPGRRVWYATSLILYACALMSKQMLVTLPALLLVLDWWPLGRLRIADCGLPIVGSAPQPSIRKSPICNLQSAILLEKLPFLLLAVAASVVVLLAQNAGGAVASAAQLPFGARIGNAVVAYALYLVKLIAPANLSVVYPYPEQVTWLGIGASATLMAALTAAVVAVRRSRPWFLAGWLWFLGTLVPVIGLVQVGQQQMADRYAYVPMIGILVAGTWGVAGLVAARRALKVSAAALAAVALVALGLLTRQELHFWKDSIELFTRATQTTTGNYFAHYNLGLAYAQARDYDRAIRSYQKSLEIKRTADALNNLGVAHLRSGNPRAAGPCFEAAVIAEPLNAEFVYNLGIAHADIGNLNEAVRCFEGARTINPRHWQAWNNEGIMYGRKGILDSALSRFSASLRINPTNPLTNLRRGKVLADLGLTDSALAAYTIALKAYPDDTGLVSEMAQLLKRRGPKIPSAGPASP